MSIASPALTTTSYKKRPTKLTKAKLAELEQGWRERNVRLKEINLPKETFEQYMDWVHGRIKKEKRRQNDWEKYSPPVESETTRAQGSRVSVDTLNEESPCGGTTNTSDKKRWVTGACSSKPSPTYTGSNIIGIATMHKSNMIPVFSDQQAVDISRMRR